MKIFMLQNYDLFKKSQISFKEKEQKMPPTVPMINKIKKEKTNV